LDCESYPDTRKNSLYLRDIVLAVTLVIALGLLLALILVNSVPFRFGSEHYVEAENINQKYIPTTSNQLSLAISNNIIYILSSGHTNSGNYEIFFRKSTDGGNSFTKAINVSNGIGQSTSPYIFANANNLYVIYSDNTTGNYEIFFRKSTDGGNSFTKAINLSNDIGQSTSPYIFSTANNLYVIYSDNTTGNYEIYFRKSTDGGNSFTKAINLSNDTGLSDFPEISASGNSVYVVWVDKTLGNYEIFYRKSTDGGNTFSKVIDLSAGVGILSDFPEISASGNSVYVVWVDRVRDYMARIVSSVGKDEIFFLKSTDGGNSFSNAINLSNDTQISTNPQLAINGASVYLAWYDRDIARNTNEIVFLKSIDGGIKFGKIVNLSNTSEFSYQPDLAACEGIVYAVWSSQVESQNFGIFLAKSIDNGNTFYKIINITTGTGFFISPKIAVSGTCNAYIVWFDYNRGPSQIYLAKIKDGVIKQVSLK
jgi:hypothetical protein